VTRDGQPVGLPPRHADVLIHLVSHAGLIVSKDDLITAAWKDQFVGPNSLDTVVSDLRRQLGDWPDDGPLIETVRRRGVRFAAPVNREDRSTYGASLAAHLLSVEGLAIATRRLGDSSVPLELNDTARGAPVDLALARAALLAEAGRVEEGTALVADAIAPPDDPSAGWILPVEPLLNVLHAPAPWRVALAKLKARAM